MTQDEIIEMADRAFDESSVTDAEVIRFAELIVRECADICMEMATKCAGLPGNGALAEDCADYIYSDFGIKNE